MKSPISAPAVSAGSAASSIVKVPGRGADARRLWLSVAQLTGRLQAVAAAAQQSADRLDRTLWPQLIPEGLHPFKLYSLPSVLRLESSQDPATDWRKFRVRAGRVLGTDATGTDGANSNPDADSFPDAADYIVPANTAAFWFWLEVSDASAVVRYSDDPTDANYDDGVNDPWSSDIPWSSAPIPDSAHIPIGYVDTLTHADLKLAIIRQYLRTDVIATAGGALCPYG